MPNENKTFHITRQGNRLFFLLEGEEPKKIKGHGVIAWANIMRHLLPKDQWEYLFSSTGRKYAGKPRPPRDSEVELSDELEGGQE